MNQTERGRLKYSTEKGNNYSKLVVRSSVGGYICMCGRGCVCGRGRGGVGNGNPAGGLGKQPKFKRGIEGKRGGKLRVGYRACR